MKRKIYSLLKQFRKIIIYKIMGRITHGVRIILLNNNQIFLVKHPYDDFWVLPGGGIQKNENSIRACVRETKEETGFTIQESIEKLGKYKNFSHGKKDYVTVYVSKKFSESPKKQKITSRLEIENKKWFSLKQLPKTSAATKRRIAEVMDKNYSFEIREW